MQHFLFGIRPEHIELTQVPLQNGLQGQINYIENLGNSYSVYLEIGGHEFVALSETGNWVQGQRAYVLSFLNIFIFLIKTLRNPLAIQKM